MQPMISLRIALSQSQATLQWIPLLWRILVGMILLAHTCATGFAHERDQPAIQETIALIKERLKSELTPTEIATLSQQQILKLITPDERQHLASDFIQFTPDQRICLYVIKEQNATDVPFWLEESGFTLHTTTIQENSETYELWYKHYAKDERVMLGIPSFSLQVSHYALAITPDTDNASPSTNSLSIHAPYPQHLKLTPWKSGAYPFSDITYQIISEPSIFANAQIVQTEFRRSKLSQLIGLYRKTDFPATKRPDQIKLTWCDNPQTSICIQWRTQMDPTAEQDSEASIVEYRAADLNELQTSIATQTYLTDETLANDPTISLFNVKLTHLKPNSRYQYRIGYRSKPSAHYRWSQSYSFKTAPAKPEGFAFNYMGDAQNGLETWGKLIHHSIEAHPEARFFVMAGDLVDRGAERDDWDHFFQHASPIFAERPIVPALGNHEYAKGEPEIYLNYFQLPENGPAALPQGKAYYFTYSNALFVILDSNLRPETQTAWLDTVLTQQRAAATAPKWIFVVFHHPAYGAAPFRENLAIRNAWVPILEKHQVDFVLQGHDHSYMRSFPLKGGEKSSRDEGVYYVVAVAGTRFHPQMSRPFAERAFISIPTYQILDIQINGDQLHYQAFDSDGKLLDQIRISKP